MNYPKLYFYRRIVQAKLYIDAHYAENIELDNIADEAYYSKFHFARKFKEVYQQTPHQYLISVRIDQAKKLLASSMPVATVCEAVGFEELSSFSRLFKRRMGIAYGYELMGESYLKKGDKASAKINYQQALTLDPNNKNAAGMVQQIGKQ